MFGLYSLLQVNLRKFSTMGFYFNVRLMQDLALLRVLFREVSLLHVLCSFNG
jgi:hypothetical protein